MDEHFSVSREQRDTPDRENRPDYGRAIEQALTGYAHDGGAWLHGRDTFWDAINDGAMIDEALRNALMAAEEDAETTPDEATDRFWLSVEGERGNHAMYGEAINRALTGYAHDGGAWLHARDMFFEALRRGEDDRTALAAALDLIREEAVSSQADAIDRFGSDEVPGQPEFFDNPEETGELTINPSRENAPMAVLEPDAERWPAATTHIGGETVSIEYNEAESIFRRVEIRGDGRAGELTPELLEKSGLLPHHRLEIDGRTMWFSHGYDIGGGRVAVVGYVQDDEGAIVARSYYKSNSQGVWRYLPQYRMSGEKISWYSKGYGEESITLPAELQEGLARSLEDDGGILELNPKDAQAAFTGTARHLGAEQTVYFRDVSAYPQHVAGIPRQKGHELPNPETIRPEYEHTPEFTKQLGSWEQDTSLYGRVRYEVYSSRDGSLKYTFCRDDQNRVWISGIENNSPVESTGLHTAWVDGGPLTVPAYEYDVQAGGFGGNYHGTNRHYVDMFENYISKLPIVREYLSHFGQ